MLSFQKGELVLRSSRRVSLERPQTTPRVMGRFAVELLRGEELVERVRFDFPLLGGGEGEEVFESGLRAEREVMVPWLSEATRARWYDRKTQAEGELPYPP